MNCPALLLFLRFPTFADLLLPQVTGIPCSFTLGFCILVRTHIKERSASLMLLQVPVIFNLLTHLFLGRLCLPSLCGSKMAGGHYILQGKIYVLVCTILEVLPYCVSSVLCSSLFYLLGRSILTPLFGSWEILSWLTGWLLSFRLWADVWQWHHFLCDTTVLPV